MNILIEGGDLNPPFAEGTRNIAIAHAKALLKRGHRVSIITRSRSRITGKKLKDFELIDGVRFYRWSNYIDLIIKFRKIMEKENIDLVHFFAKGVRPMMYFKILKILTKKPFLFSLLGLPSYSDERKQIGRVIKSLKNVDLVVIPSKSLFIELRKWLRSVNLPFGIDLKKFKDKKLDRDYILCLRTPSDELMQALERLSEEFPKLGFRLNKSGVNRKFQSSALFSSQLKANEYMPAVYNRARVFIDLHDPNNHLECASPPAAILEAMACGTKVVSTLMPEIEEIVADKRTGFLVKNNKSEEIYATLKIALASNDSVKKNASKMVFEKYDLEKVVIAYERIYNKLCTKS